MIKAMPCADPPTSATAGQIVSNVSRTMSKVLFIHSGITESSPDESHPQYYIPEYCTVALPLATGAVHATKA